MRNQTYISSDHPSGARHSVPMCAKLLALALALALALVSHIFIALRASVTGASRSNRMISPH